MEAAETVVYDWSADFLSDWRDNMARYLESLGYLLPGTDDAETVFFKLRSVERRSVSIKAREIFVSKEFTCPSEHVAGMEELKRRIKAGEDIKPHLSKGIFNADYEDALLTDWGVLHFHLGIDPHEDIPGLVERTGPVLFALVTEDAFHLIDVKGHGSWASKDLIEIVHSNWPELIARFKINGILGAEQEPDEKGRKKLRKNAINTFVTVSDGTIYYPPGMGFVSNGKSLEDTRIFLQTRKVITALDKKIAEELPELIREIEKTGNDLKLPIRFKLIGIDEGLPVINAIGSDDAIVLQFKLP